MALPAYDKAKRKKTFEQLPKGAYVIKIKDAKEEQNRNGTGSHLSIAFDIAEGEYKDIYQRRYEGDANPDKRWPLDAIYYLNVPNDNSQQYIWDNWNTFFADLEDSNNGFVFSGDVKKLKNKLLGGKFAIEQTEYNGNVYDHTRLRWTCVADDVRNGKAGKMPNDKLISKQAAAPSDGFMDVPLGSADEIPF